MYVLHYFEKILTVSKFFWRHEDDIYFLQIPGIEIEAEDMKGGCTPLFYAALAGRYTVKCSKRYYRSH